MSRARSFARTTAAAAIGATLALVIAGFAGTRQASARKISPLAACERDLARQQAANQELMAGLEQIERINARPQRDTAARIQRAIRDTRQRAAQHLPPRGPERVVVPAPGPGPIHAHPAPHHAGPYVISSRDFNALLSSVKNASFDKEKLAVLSEAARHHAFTVDQTIAIMGTCSFDDTKVEAAVILHPRVVDQANWYRVYEALTFSGSRDKLRARIP